MKILAKNPSHVPPEELSPFPPRPCLFGGESGGESMAEYDCTEMILRVESGFLMSVQ